MKESYISQDKNVIFREVFNSAATVLANGGTETDTTIDNGIATLNGSSSDILYKEKNLGTAHSVRLRGTFSSVNSNQPIIANDGDNTCIVIYPSVGIYYRDGTSIISAITCDLAVDTTYDIIITRNGTTIKGYIDGVQIGVTRTLGSNDDFIFNVIGSYDSGTDYYGGTIDNITIYEKTLIAEEVSALYKNSLYTAPTLEDAVLHIPCQGSVIDLEGNTIVNANAVVKRDGSKDVMKFNGSTSVLDCGNDASLQLTASILLATWVKTTDTGVQIIAAKDDDTNRNFGLYMDSGAIKFYIFVSGAAKEVVSNASTFDDDRWHRIIAINNGTDLLIYIDGQLTPSTGGTGNGGVMDNDTVDLTIGDRALLDMPFSGKLDDIKMLSTVWTAEQVTRDYSSSKSNYNL